MKHIPSRRGFEPAMRGQRRGGNHQETGRKVLRNYEHRGPPTSTRIDGGIA